MQRTPIRPGVLVQIRGRRWRVDRVQRDRLVGCVDVSGPDGRRTFLTPFDRPVTLASGRRLKRAGVRQMRARLAALLGRTASFRLPDSAVAAGIAILPHQLEPALAVLGGARRLLIADEVGLGKTIQAALIAAELSRRDGSFRGLLLVPASLRTQWMDEMRDRFALTCRTADADAIAQLMREGRRGDNPWLGAGLWIASLDYLKQPHVFETLPLRPWDLLIIDEAHGVSGESRRHDAAHTLARRSRVVVALTATPHSGDDVAFDRLVGLGALHTPTDPLLVFRRTRRDVSLTIARRVRWNIVTPSPPESALLDALSAFERAALTRSGDERHAAAVLLLSVFRKRALSTPAAFALSLTRRLAWLDTQTTKGSDAIQPSFDFETDDDELAAGEWRALTAPSGLEPDDERRWLTRLEEAADAARGNESKARHLARLLERAREPVIVFTEFRDSLTSLMAALASVRPLAVIHGGLTPGEQAGQISAFLSGRASVLLATDVAAQGLNLQGRARWIVNLELPWNPIRLEQRAGRVDRIGQRRDVHVSLLIARHPAESGMLARLTRRTLAAQRALGRDVLHSTLPDERHVRGAVMTGRLPEEPAPPPSRPLAVCRRWERPARRIAAQFRRRRALVQRWQGPSDRTSRARLVCVRRTESILVPVNSSIVLIFSVSIHDDVGVEVERSIVALQSRGAGSLADLIAAGRAKAAQTRRALLRRIAVLRRNAASRSATGEHAIEAALLEAVQMGELELGLFDRRMQQIVNRRAVEIESIRTGSRHRLELLRRGTRLGIAEPVLEFVIVADGADALA